MSEEYTVYVKTEDEYGNLSEVVSTKVSKDFAYDGTTDNNLRYIGANPNNYVTFNNELWRIIGVMNNVEDKEGNTESKIKLIRDESIGAYSWDSSPSSINDGKGVNEWSVADLNVLLNDFYYNRKINQKCSINYNDEMVLCSFEKGINDNTKNYIETIKWNTGSNSIEKAFDNILTSQFYEFERSDIAVSKTVTGVWNDEVVRTTSWIGKIALIYPSDNLYASSGGFLKTREQCLQIQTSQWRDYEDCYINNWTNHLENALSEWTLSSASMRTNNSNVYVYKQGTGAAECSPARNVYPSLFLKSNTKITKGIGTEEDPFELSL